MAFFLNLFFGLLLLGMIVTLLFELVLKPLGILPKSHFIDPVINFNLFRLYCWLSRKSFVIVRFRRRKNGLFVCKWECGFLKIVRSVPPSAYIFDSFGSDLFNQRGSFYSGWRCLSPITEEEALVRIF